MLRVRGIYKSFGGIKALNGVSLNVEKGTIIGLIGPNGSGKTTLFNVISGFCPKDSGEIYFKGKKIDGLPPHEVANRGLRRSFQIPKMAYQTTVLENILFASNSEGENIWKNFFNFRLVSKQEEASLHRAQSVLNMLQLDGLANEYAGSLSGGQRKLLALGRVLMADPDLIMLDEPAAGVNPTLLKALLQIVKQLRVQQKKTFLIVEHNMKVIWEMCDKVYVLVAGKEIAEGTPEEIQRNEEVLRAYLGREEGGAGRKG